MPQHHAKLFISVTEYLEDKQAGNTHDEYVNGKLINTPLNRTP